MARSWTFLVLSLCVLSSPLLSAPAALEEAETDPRLLALGEELQELDREIRNLADLAERSPGEAELERQGAELRRHLRLVEGRLRRLGDPATRLYLSKLRSITLLATGLETGKRPFRAPVPLPRSSLFPPAADLCADAPVIGDGTFAGDTTGADRDGGASCGVSRASPDVWWRYVAPADGTVVARALDATYDTVLSVHSSCPGTISNEIVCGDDAEGSLSSVTFDVQAGEEVLIRASGFARATGSFTLEVGRFGAISGTVNRAGSGEPLAGATVSIWSVTEGFVTSAVTNALGEYVAGVGPGTYYALAELDTYLGESYGEMPCVQPLGCEPTLGTPIDVVSGTTVSGIDFTLELGGVISGTVTEAVTGAPVPEFFDVAVWSLAGKRAGTGYVGTSGSYTAKGLPTGTYFVTTENLRRFLPELFDDLPCPGGAFIGCDPSAGTPVEAVAGETTAGINFALDRLGVITGTVVTTDGQPIPDVTLWVYDSRGLLIGSSRTDASGTYATDGLPPGTYFVRTAKFSEFLDELYDDFPCPAGGCDPTAGTPVEVAVNAETRGIDFGLSRLGSIAGTVTAAATGQPIAGAEVVLYDGRGFWQMVTGTDAEGRYRFDDLLAGTYYATTTDDIGFFAELYDDIPCGPDGCDPLAGTPIAVALGQTTSGVDFALVKTGSISGRVLDQETGQGIQLAEVRVWNTAGDLAARAETDASGVFSATHLDPGTYFATTRSRSDHLDELYDDIPCPGGAIGCDPTTGTPIQVTKNNDTPGIDFELRRLGAISGTVTQAATGQPLESVRVYVYDTEGRSAAAGVSDEAGDYKAGGLLPGTYFVATEGHLYYRGELYDDLPCEDPDSFACDPTVGTPVLVEVAATTSDVDFALDLEHGISGTVTDEETGAAVPGVLVDVWNDVGQSLVRTVSGTGGRYDVGLDAGVYFLSTENDLGAVDQVYEDIPCPDGPAFEGRCDVLFGTPVEVGPSQVRGGVDFALSGVPCLSTPTALCLRQNRFRVEVAWTDSQGHRGSGRKVELTSDSGYFWFFDPGNVELVVKLLDGCFEPFDSFWFFAAGLTDVALEITVTDTATGAVKKYVNELGSAFEPILDASAFATCDAATEPSESAEPRSPAPPPAAAQETACTPGPENLCLSDARFLVEASWRTKDGETGDGRAVALTEDTGYFWFFGPNNVEAVVKVLDACRLEPFHSFWVFAAGLTDVEVTLRVIDTDSGEVRQYENPLGRAFRPVLDTRAFRTCPEGDGL